MLIWGCRKDFPQLQSHQMGAKAVDRDEFVVTLSWLEDFQPDLVSALDYQALSQSYTIEEIVNGIEALINIATATPEPRTAHRTQITLFQVNTSNDAQAIRDVYNTSYNAYRNFWLSTDTTETYPVVMDVNIDSVNGNTAYIRTTSILGTYNYDLDQNYTYDDSSESCEPFGEEEGYRVGAGDEELSLLNFYWNLPCPGACGETPSDEAGPTTAYEEIEARINFNYSANNPPCSSNAVLLGWVNVKMLDAYPLTFLKDDCPFVDNQQVKTCMEKQELDCAFCSIYPQIGEEPLEIPSGYNFVSLNLGLTFCACGGSNECDYATPLVAEYFVGRPVCKLTPSYPWVNPRYVDLSNIIIP